MPKAKSMVKELEFISTIEKRIFSGYQIPFYFKSSILFITKID